MNTSALNLADSLNRSDVPQELRKETTMNQEQTRNDFSWKDFPWKELAIAGPVVGSSFAFA
jgi:hypothetical protein